MLLFNPGLGLDPGKFCCLQPLLHATLKGRDSRGNFSRLTGPIFSIGRQAVFGQFGKLSIGPRGS